MCHAHGSGQLHSPYYYSITCSYTAVRFTHPGSLPNIYNTLILQYNSCGEFSGKSKILVHWLREHLEF